MDRDNFSELLKTIDAQITAKKNTRPAGDRRRLQGKPPEGMAERRAGIDRRNRAKSH